MNDHGSDDNDNDNGDGGDNDNDTTTTAMTTIEEGTHLQLKTERMAVDSDILVCGDGRTDIQKDGHSLF